MRLAFPPLAAMLLAAALAAQVHAQPQPAWRWDTHTDFDACYRDRFLDSEAHGGSVQLVRRVVIADEMGKGYNDVQFVRGKTQARKILLLDSADVTGALLMIGGNVESCDIVVNGTVLGARPIEREYWHADFDSYVIPPGLLRAGANDFVFRARDEKSNGHIRIENCVEPNRSAVSRDGGHDWDFDRLAEGGYCNGELQVRLSVERYAPQATLRSPMIDLAASFTRHGLPAAVAPRLATLEIDADTPPGTAVQAFVRSGETPDGYEENWSPWFAWPAQRDAVPWGRFAQWKLVLTTTAAQQTPVVRQVVAKAAFEQPGHGPPFASLAIVEDGNQRIVRSSYDFAYADYDRNSRLLRDHFKLADVVQSGTSEFEQLKLMRQWVREQWNDGWDWGPLQYIPSWDARVLLTMAPRNLSLGMCTHYATTYVQCSSSLGHTSRSIFRGHALSETWSNEHRKWVVMDAGMDANDQRRATYHFVRAGQPDVPLSELEVHRAYWEEQKWDDIRLVATNMSEGSAAPEEPFGADLEPVLKGMQEIFLPLRNNFIDHREPEEPEHGQGYFKFTGHLYWKSAVTPEVPWTDFFTTRAADLYWTLNQAQIYLREPEAGLAAVDVGGVSMPVMLDTATPNFAGYEVRFNGGEWQMWLPADARPAFPAGPPLDARAYAMKPTGGSIEFPWPLRQGANTIEARPINKAGMRGITSKLAVEVGP